MPFFDTRLELPEPFQQESAELFLYKKILDLIWGFRGHSFTSPDMILREVNEILKHPIRIPIYRLTATCLRAEIFRSQEKFGMAESEYRAAIEEAEGVEQIEHLDNEWFIHYLPRAHLGLITVLRRMLKSNHEEIQQLIEFAKREFFTFPVEDFEAQVKAVEGVYLRQIGDSESALTLLREAAEQVKKVTVPYYQFWYPEQIEAHRLIVCLTTPGLGGQGQHLASQLLERGEGEEWSKSVALIAQLHFILNNLIEANYNPQTIKNSLKSKKEAGGILKKLKEMAPLTKDPTLMSEVDILGAAWNAAAEEFDMCEQFLESLAKEKFGPSLSLLRGVEAAAIRQSWYKNRHNSNVVKKLCDTGLKALDFLGKRLKSYGYETLDYDWCSSILSERFPNNSELPWTNEALIKLRARLWP